MLPEETRQELRNRLLLRRKEIIEQNKRLQDVWQNLDFTAVEYQDRSQLETTTSGMEGLNRRQREEIAIIDSALERMRDDTYGMCTSCGEPIREERLRALPWAELCTDCKDLEERIQRRRQEAAGESEPAFFPGGEEPLDLSGASDEEILERIEERVEERGLLDLEGVEMDCENGLVRLTGIISSEMQREMLLAMLRDELGITEIEDELVVTIDPSRTQGEDLEDLEGLDETDEDRLWPGEDSEDGLPE